MIRTGKVVVVRPSTPIDTVAIVGIGCRFPGANNPCEFWELLSAGKDMVGQIPAERRELFESALMKNESVGARHGAFIDDVAGFDWRAFSISPREAKFMDPQQRLLLEVAWEALEDAGIAVDSLGGSSTSVYVGIMWNDYAKLQMSRLDGYSVGGGSLAFAANRISHVFDLNGPSMSLDVSCASSLVAIHQACQSIRVGESQLAIAGGVNLMLAPDTTQAIAKAGILSEQGRCSTFDVSADGFVRGEGVGLVILKPFSRALDDGDRIYATIRATTVMHSGRSEWIMAPSAAVQERMLKDAYARAGVDPAQVDFVELHGTGTKKGDPIEAEALGAVVGAKRNARRPCIVGSVKTNIGHLDSAAGIAGLIKTALAVHHREVPASLNVREVNPEIDLEALGLEHASSLTPWPQSDRLPLAGVTGLSFGGGNAHVVVEGVREAKLGLVEAGSAALVPLSGHSPAALLELATRYTQLLRDEPEVGVFTIGAAAGRRRAHHRCRAAFVADTRDALARQLDDFIAQGRPKAPRRRKDPPRIVLVMPDDEVAGRVDGVRELLKEPAFLEEVERCDHIVQRLASWSIIERLKAPSDATRDPRCSQPISWAIDAGLASLWRSWGLLPEAVVGTGIGEVSAAYVAGLLTLEDAARVAIGRGHVLHAATSPKSAPLRDFVRGFEAELQLLRACQPRLRFVSSIADPAVQQTEIDARHWGRTIDTTARLEDAIEKLRRDGGDVFIGLGAQAPRLLEGPKARSSSTVSVRSADRDGTTRETMLRALGQLYISGCDIDWPNVVPKLRGHVPLPMYPWQRERMWLT